MFNRTGKSHFWEKSLYTLVKSHFSLHQSVCVCGHDSYARVCMHPDTQLRWQARTCMEQRMTLLGALVVCAARAQYGGAFRAAVCRMRARRVRACMRSPPHAVAWASTYLHRATYDAVYGARGACGACETWRRVFATVPKMRARFVRACMHSPPHAVACASTYVHGATYDAV